MTVQSTVRNVETGRTFLAEVEPDSWANDMCAHDEVTGCEDQGTWTLWPTPVTGEEPAGNDPVYVCPRDFSAFYDAV